MVNIGFWNVRGLNSLAKQKEINWFLQNNKVELFGLLETRVRSNNLNKVLANLDMKWSICTNYSHHPGGRIWLLWNPMIFQVLSLETKNQAIHAKCQLNSDGRVFWITMVYGFNKMAEKEELWQSLCRRDTYGMEPWLWCGDFNSITSPTDRIGIEVHLAEIRPFTKCISHCKMGDIMSTGAYYTWNNKKGPDTRVCSRIDRVLHNDEWLLQFPNSRARFLPEGLFDHCPCVISLEEDSLSGRGGFKYFNMWGQSNQFKGIVAAVWQHPMYRLPVYQVVKKLKLLKQPLRQINRGQFADIKVLAQKALVTLLEKQTLIQHNPDDSALIKDEIEAAAHYDMLSKGRTSFLAQKAKTQWVKEGDANTSYFHCCIKARRRQNRILEILDMEGGLCTEPEQINKAFEAYYLTILGTHCPVIPVHQATVDLSMTISEEHRMILSELVQPLEVKEAIFGIPSSKAPGPDGFNSQFFKDA
ncbi:hypothetical protein vseg_007452 [Gypsophila vaccaria]